jgi:hypothetical protein
MARTRLLAALVAALLTAGGCTDRNTSGPGTPTSPLVSATAPPLAASPTASPTGTSTAAPQATASASCPTTHSAPDPKRPVVNLHFRLGTGRVDGAERIVFTPDRPVDELVFRLWPNSPQTAGDGARMSVSSVRVDGRVVRPRLERAGAPAGAPGTLLSVPLSARVAAGTSVTVELRFVVRLPAVIPDRLGHSAHTAWWASAHPMLAWERGRGWNTEVAPTTPGEGQSSEAFELRQLTVDVPAGHEVLATGTPVRTTAGRPGRRVHTFRARSVRDVAVVAGDLTVRRTTVAGVPLVVGRSVDGVGPDGSEDIATVLRLAAASVEDMTRRFGPFPYERLSLALLPGISGGIEYPGLIFLGGQANQIIVPHEVAHEWFYGLVGDNQARDPWLDEAFATYAEALFNGHADYVAVHEDPAALDRVGAPMSFWDTQRRGAYQDTVYAQGAGALLEARRKVGAARFDAAIRCFVNLHAHRIARPEDLRAALAALPTAIEELQAAGAL